MIILKYSSLNEDSEIKQERTDSEIRMLYANSSAPLLTQDYGAVHASDLDRFRAISG